MAHLLISKAMTWGMNEQTAGRLRKTSAFIRRTTEKQTTTTWQLVAQAQTQRREYQKSHMQEMGTLKKRGCICYWYGPLAEQEAPRPPSAVLLFYRLLINSL